MKPLPPWSAPNWPAETEPAMDAALAEVGRPRLGAVRTEKAWGRSCVQTVDTEAGPVWIKYGYGLPPGEELVLARLVQRWPDRVPEVVATWPGAVAMSPLPGVELTPAHALNYWCDAARGLAELEAGERSHVEAWLALGVRDRRAKAWSDAVHDLLASPVLAGLDGPTRARLEAFVPEFISRFIDNFTSPATLVHQDSGCCNMHLDEASGRVVHFDWTDVVVGHPVFSCDRLLDQALAEHHGAIIDAFCEPLGIDLVEYWAMRRSNVLHEVLRYHDEIEHVDREDPMHASLSKSVCSQLKALVDFETARSHNP